MADRRELTRRDVLRVLGLAGAAGALTPGVAAGVTPGRARRLTARAAATAPAGSDLGAVEHIVFLMMENRSYDHYFGAYPKGRGFDDHPRDRLGPFAQPYPDGGALSPAHVLLPFRNRAGADTTCVVDLTHDWGPMHECWSHGAMDSWVRVHTSSAHEGAAGVSTMSYCTREELPFYWSCADAFTLLDGYHCSALGPTHPNRLMSLSGTIDPAGAHGGPVTATSSDPNDLWGLSWTTMPELLEDKGVAWKVYHPTFANLSAKYAYLAAYPMFNPYWYDPTANPIAIVTSDHILLRFEQYESPASALHQKAFLPSFPNDFVQDIAAGTLPSVSWLIPPLGFDEHPSASPGRGEFFTSLVLEALMGNPAVWAKTVLFVMWDENDGFFDHVAPPVAPPGTPGEYITAAALGSDTLGIRGPVGLGARVPGLMMSPFSRGGHVASEVFDHTSQLKLIAERFGVEVPNVSAWRRGVVGDLTSALFIGAPDHSMPALATTSVSPLAPVSGPCNEIEQDSEQNGEVPAVPHAQTMPTQDGRQLPASRFTDVSAAAATAVKHRGAPTAKGPRNSTHKALSNTVTAPGGALAATGLPPELAAVAAGLLGAAAAFAATLLRSDQEPSTTTSLTGHVLTTEQ